MKPPRKSLLMEAKRAIDWFDEPDAGPEQSLMKAMWAAWTRFAERVPPPGSVVLVSDGHSVALGRVDEGGQLEVSEEHMKPTHWLPLPPPPEPVNDREVRSIFRHNRVWRRYT
ncbi:MAG: hypothetical protein HQM00_09730 [Magnetococcales bacterium]|nr:hypothetical protein [Magnetococcales bacterium]